MQLNNVVPLRPQQPAVSDACRWHEAFEQIFATNFRIVCAWQRMAWRAIWRM